MRRSRRTGWSRHAHIDYFKTLVLALSNGGHRICHASRWPVTNFASQFSNGPAVAAPGAEDTLVPTYGPTRLPKPEPSATVAPALGKRVHELDEELGREDGRAVEAWERGAPGNRKTWPLVL